MSNKYEDALRYFNCGIKNNEKEHETIRHALSVMSQLTEARKKATAGEWEYYNRNERSLGAAISDDVSKEDFTFALQFPEPPFAFGKIGALITYDNAENNAAFIAIAANLTREE